ncbi:hypothetical protein NDU88_004784 [Pleurodeles waltl]|uniref:Uncharacterized protein n=1 Tax=Pleurodeles waltl TaxID=8319 RepID=A0AAV7VKU4_PLEWA|nr:hypothetical protein NDU88_004784 [Pleurodeles waltl]
MARAAGLVGTFGCAPEGGDQVHRLPQETSDEKRCVITFHPAQRLNVAVAARPQQESLILSNPGMAADFLLIRACSSGRHQAGHSQQHVSRPVVLTGSSMLPQSPRAEQPTLRELCPTVRESAAGHRPPLPCFLRIIRG